MTTPTPSPADPAQDLTQLLGAPATRPWYRRTWFWALLLLLVLAAAGLWWWQSSRTAKAAPSFVTQPAVRGNLTLRVPANGTLQPTRAMSCRARCSRSTWT